MCETILHGDLNEKKLHKNYDLNNYLYETVEKKKVRSVTREMD